MGQFIRVPIDLETRVECLSLARKLAVPPELAAIILFRFSVWADQNADEGRFVKGVDAIGVDAAVRFEGFYKAAEDVGLLWSGGTDDDPEVQITTHLVHPETWRVRVKKLQADADRKRQDRANGVRRKSAGNPPDVQRGEDSRAE